MYQRHALRLKQLKTSFFLFGPRGTGKTHWVKQTFPDAIYIDLLKDDTYNEYLKRPSQLEEVIPPNFDGWVIIDEVQKVPSLLNEVHRLIESRRLRFVLTGSSARKLRKKGVNLLAGRALVFHMYPLTAQELGDDFSLDHALSFGHLPSTFSHPDPQAYLKSYIGVYLKEEVSEEGLTRSLDTFARALEVASFSQGSMINYSEIAREVGVDRRVIQSYFSIFEDLLLATTLPIFSKRAKRKLVSKKKFYFFDVGVYRQLRPKGPFDRPEEVDGAALKSLFFQELRAVNDYDDLGYTLYFWRTADEHEVDFVLYGEKGIIAFEIKRSKQISSSDLKGMRLFLEDYPEAKCYALYGGSQKRYFGQITALPFIEAVKSLPSLIC